MNVLGCSWHLVDLDAAEHHTMHFQYLAWKAIVPKFRNVPDNGSQLLGMILRQEGVPFLRTDPPEQTWPWGLPGRPMARPR